LASILYDYIIFVLSCVYSHIFLLCVGPFLMLTGAICLFLTTSRSHETYTFMSHASSCYTSHVQWVVSSCMRAFHSGLQCDAVDSSVFIAMFYNPSCHNGCGRPRNPALFVVHTPGIPPKFHDRPSRGNTIVDSNSVKAFLCRPLQKRLQSYRIRQLFV